MGGVWNMLAMMPSWMSACAYCGRRSVHACVVHACVVTSRVLFSFIL